MSYVRYCKYFEGKEKKTGLIFLFKNGEDEEYVKNNLESVLESIGLKINLNHCDYIYDMLVAIMENNTFDANQAKEILRKNERKYKYVALFNNYVLENCLEPL